MRLLEELRRIDDRGRRIRERVREIFRFLWMKNENLDFSGKKIEDL